jgi:hypothetical protein
MPDQSKKKKSNFTVILIVGGLLLAAGGAYYVYTTYFQASGILSEGQESRAPFPLKKVDWEKDLFSAQPFRSLSGDIPLRFRSDVGDVGNESPFITTR